MSEIHQAAQTGFGNEAQAYARGRPEYPQALVPWLRDTLGLNPKTSVADIGAGTGKFTRLLTQLGSRVLAVEPVDAMRQRIEADLPGVTALAGTAQALPLADASVDAVACAQAFHWFASTAALDELARVLKPGGKLGLVWNVRDESVDWVAALTRIITPYEGDAPRFYKGDWRKPFPHPLFGPLHETRFAYQHVGTPQAVIVDRFMSVSFIASQPPADNADVRRQINDLIATHPALKGRETLSFPYYTLAFSCERIA